MRRGRVRVKEWLPPKLVRLVNHWTGRYSRLSGRFASWEEAVAQSKGYDSPDILARVDAAAAEVLAGRAAFDRDGVAFRDPEHRFPLLAGLSRAAARQGRLHVLDFGGALGSTYRQCRGFLDDLPDVRWRVVEQPHIAQWGHDHYATPTLGFFTSIEDAVADVAPNIVLFSGVLQYLSDPFAVLSEALSLGAETIIIDRTPIIEAPEDIVCLQIVSRRIVRSDYPIRLFTRSSLLSRLPDHDVVAEFDALDAPMGGVLRRVDFKGFILDRKRGPRIIGYGAALCESRSSGREAERDDGTAGFFRCGEAISGAVEEG